MSDTEPTFDAAVELAKEAFWEKFAASFPDAKSGDVPPDALRAFDRACASAARTWLLWNLD